MPLMLTKVVRSAACCWFLQRGSASAGVINHEPEERAAVYLIMRKTTETQKCAAEQPP